jgi:hypothetical protein
MPSAPVDVPPPLEPVLPIVREDGAAGGAVFPGTGEFVSGAFEEDTDFQVASTFTTCAHGESSKIF